MSTQLSQESLTNPESSSIKKEVSETNYDNEKKEENVSDATEIKSLENKIESLSGDEKDDQEKKDQTTRTKITARKGNGPATLSPLSKKLRRDTLRTQLKRACTLALADQPKTNSSIKTRARRHSTGTSKDSATPTTKKPVIKKNLRKTIGGSNTMKRKREQSADHGKIEEAKTALDLENENGKDPKLRRKSNESSLSEPLKSESEIKKEKDLESPVKSSAEIVKEENVVNSPVRARRSTRLSPETISKAIVGAKKRGRLTRSTVPEVNTQEIANSDSNKSVAEETIKDVQKEVEIQDKKEVEMQDVSENKTTGEANPTSIDESKPTIKEEKSNISEIKVHQFYSKPEFFENNLGIEKDIALLPIKIETNIPENQPPLNDESNSNLMSKEQTCETKDVESDCNQKVDEGLGSIASDKEENVEKVENIEKSEETESPEKPEDLKPEIVIEKVEQIMENEEKQSNEIEKEKENEVEQEKEIIHEEKQNEESNVEDVLQNSPEKEIIGPIEEKNVSAITEDSEEHAVEDIENSVGNDIFEEIVFEESPETQREKEDHLKHLGLLTHQAAKDEKRKNNEKKSEFIEDIYDSSSNSKFENEYTGTLKTVIKLNRPAIAVQSNVDCDTHKKKSQSNNISTARQSLKMTFQKGRVRHTNVDKKNNQISEDDYYTIQNEAENNSNCHNRKSRSNTEDKCSEISEKTDEKKEILIPEKASSFAIHPGRLCQDQCFYCGGKFGLYDTPCHVAQIKSAERQSKILKNEEKLTVDNCLCDACFRHVDRRANTPAYKKRLNDFVNGSSASTSATPKNIESDNNLKATNESDNANTNANVCFIPDCKEVGQHSLQKKIAKKRLKKFLPPDLILAGAIVHVCQNHYDVAKQHAICNLCKRRLNKSHMFPILQNLENIFQRLKEQEIHLEYRKELVVCRQCKYYLNILSQEDYEKATKKSDYCKTYRKRLYKIYNKSSQQPISNEGSSMYMDTSSEETNRNESHTTDEKAVEVSDSYVIHTSDSDSDSVTNKEKSDISTVLRSNPNLSMRELFPGEEELGVQFKAPFNTSFSEKTPEGWTRVQSSLQYDETTRKLWEELQKPYGNLSSFLRHLIILEKFYRNGDLILSPKASTNSSTYNSCVQNRLKSYDNFSPNKAIAQFDEEVNKIQKQLSNNSVTMTTKPKDNVKSFQSTSSTVSSVNVNNTNNKDVSNSAPAKHSTPIQPHKPSTEFPPELISISKGLTSNVSNPLSKPKSILAKPNTSQIANLIKLPETLTPQERLSSKNWRPTLIPLTSSAHLNQHGPLYLTADGRRLPALVQVQSNKRPFLISIHDYNRMCILRREKLLRDQMLKANNRNALNGMINTQIGQGNSNNNNNSTNSSNANNKKIFPKMSGNFRQTTSTATSSRPSTSMDFSNLGTSPSISSSSSSSTTAQFFNKNQNISNLLPNSSGGYGNNIKTSSLLKDRDLLSKIPKNLTVIPQIKSQAFSNASLLSVFPQTNLINKNIQDKKNVEK